MKNILLTFGLILSLNTSAQDTMDTIENYLEDRFVSIYSIGSMYFMGATNQCDQKVSVFVVGDLGSGTTAFDCELCLVNDSGFASVDSDFSECYREGN